MSLPHAAILLYTCALVSLFVFLDWRVALAIWMLVGSHSLIVLIALDRKGVIKL